MTKYKFQEYPKFYDNPFIKEIAARPKWTISDKDKIPVNFADLKIVREDPRIKIHGANQYDPTNMTSLPNLLTVVPNATNHAYMLDAKRDGFVVLDIEKTCPDSLKQEFLKLPYMYGEYSLSGTGIHLICPLPGNFNNYPDYRNAVKLQEKHGWYEILLYHWVTFTRNNLTPMTSYGDKKHKLDDVFNLLIKENPSTKSVNAKTFANRPKIPLEKRLLHLCDDLEYDKQPEDFPKYDKQENYIGPDMSKYEFGMTSYLYYRVSAIIESYPSLRAVHYTDEQKAWILYDLLKAKLPYRRKHDTFHQHMPWLLYNASVILAKANAEKQSQAQPKNGKVKKSHTQEE